MHLYEQIIPILTVYAYDVASVGRINLFLGNFFFIFLYLQVATLKHFLILFNTIIFMTHF